VSNRFLFCSGDLRSPSAATGRRYSGLLTVLLVASVRAADPRSVLDSGVEAYRARQFEAAQKAFSEAATNAASAQLDPAVARYDEGSAAYRLGRADTAAERFAEALRTGNLPLQQRAWYNRGDALLGQMAAQQQQGKFEYAQKLAGEAATHFEQAILLDPGDVDAKVNYELSLRLQQEMEKQKQEQEKQQQQKQDQNQDKDKDKDKQKQDQQDQKQDQQSKPDDKQKPDQQQQDQKQPQQDQQQSQAEKKDNEMTQEEALQLLNAMRQEEQAQREKLRMNLGQPEPVEKDW
jgi:Ca-activated chloride channel family protein